MTNEHSCTCKECTSKGASNDNETLHKEELFRMIQQNEETRFEDAQASLFRRLDNDTRLAVFRWSCIYKELLGESDEQTT
jgi:hypothetical protein